MTWRRCCLPITFCLIQLSHDVGLESFIVHYGKSSALQLAAILPLFTSLMTVGLLSCGRKNPHVLSSLSTRRIPLISMLVAFGNYASLRSLRYIDFKSRLIVKTSKPALMSIGLFVAQRFGVQVVAPTPPRAIAVGLGASLYTFGHESSEAEKADMQGSYFLLVAGIIAETIAGTLEAALLNKRHASIASVTYLINLWKIPFCLLMALSSIPHFYSHSPTVLLLGGIGAVGQLVFFAALREFGGEFTASLSAGRKALTYGISTIIFTSKPMSGISVAGLAFVGAGMFMPSRREKVQRKGYETLPHVHVPV